MVKIAVRFLAVLSIVGSAIAAGAAPADNTLTEAEQKAGWKLLFDGKTTTGWRCWKKDKISDGWQVIDGVLARVKAGGDIITVDQYENFDLQVDWKMAPAGNSGIMYLVQETGHAPYETGPEYQLLDDAHHKVAPTDLTASGACYALYPPAKGACHPVGEWNHTRILFDHRKVEHWLNGEKIVECEVGSTDWNDKVAKSKFKAWPDFAKAAKGHIDLQDHGGQVEFKNIKIRVIE